MYGQKNRKRPLEREQNEQLEDLRDDCIALFINSGLKQKDITARGGPTPTTISKWLYKETHFPRYSTIESFLLALGYGLTAVSLEKIKQLHDQPRRHRLQIDIEFAGRPRMPARKKVSV